MRWVRLYNNIGLRLRPPILTLNCLLFIATNILIAQTNLTSQLEDQDNIIEASKIIKTDESVEQSCAACRLVSHSIDDILTKPRQMNAYGRMDDKIDLEKIKKGVCKDIASDGERERCRDFFFTKIGTIQKWKHSTSKANFFDFVCIKELKYCCPRNSYGPKCTKCIECNKNEHCHGEGTRSGNGTCVCKEGYTGNKCAFCARHYYLHNGNQQSTSMGRECRPCHRSCLYCRHGGPTGCEVCRSGYTWIPTYGCSDVDECLQNDGKICGDNTFCVNTEGSYFCYECDRACDGCNGDGPDMCLKCAKGYNLEKGNCVATKRTILPPEANYYRYAIYAGLGVCTCIILSNNVYLASFVGLIVALYMGFSEYIMSSHLESISQTHPGRAPTQ